MYYMIGFIFLFLGLVKMEKGWGFGVLQMDTDVVSGGSGVV